MGWKQGLSTGIWVFLGIVAGTVVNVCTSLYLKRRQEQQDVKNLRFEIAMNIKKIETWQQYLSEFRTCVGTGSTASFYRWFDLSKFITLTASRMFNEGTLYKYLSHDDIASLQGLMSELSSSGERYMNEQIDRERTSLDPTRALSTLGFLEEKFRRHKKTLETLQEKIK